MTILSAPKSQNSLKGGVSEKAYEAIIKLLKVPKQELTLLALEAILTLKPTHGLGSKTNGALAEWYHTYFVRFEGSVPFMYLDTKGNITVGQGILVLPFNVMYKDPKVALKAVKERFKALESFLEKDKKLSFVVYESPAMSRSGEFSGTKPRQATDEELQKALSYLYSLADERKISSRLNMVATTCFNLEKNNVFLTKETIEWLTLAATLEKLKDLTAVFSKDYSTFPAGAQLAFLDMSYNMGASGLKRNFPNLSRLATDKKWSEIAYGLDHGKAYFSRRDVSEARNTATKILFILAAEAASGKPSGGPK